MLEGIVLTVEHLATRFDDNRMLIEMAVEEADEAGFAAVEQDVAALEAQMADLQATLAEVREQEAEAKTLLKKSERKNIG